MKYQVKTGLGVTLQQDGATFRVWAPFAQKMYLSTPYTPYESGERQEMNSEGEGYWSLSVPDVKIGQSYKYTVETPTGEFLERNDPRARALTDSDSGSSIVVSNDFDWGDDMFMPLPKDQQVIYELHIGTFNRPDQSTPGTFRDAIEKLDYLQALGINTIELMPVTSMAANSNGWGYATNELFSVESSYGGRHGLMEFVKACHVRGIGVILDIVYNHLTAESSLWRFDGWTENDLRGGIYFFSDERGDTPWGGRPDYGRPEVRQFILDNVVMWFNEFRLDGLRLDSTAYMRNTAGGSDDPAHDVDSAWVLLGAITKLEHKVRPVSIIIADDTYIDLYLTKSTKDGGCGFDAQWGLNFSHALKTRLGLPAPFPTDLVTELASRYNDNVYERIIFSDSHDTAANGNTRLNEATSPGNAENLLARQRQLAANSVVLTAPGIPMLLQGQEFLQDGDFNNWLELEWEKADKFAGIVAAHHDLISLRTSLPALRGQSINIFHQDADNNVLAYERLNNDDRAIVIANFGHNKYDSYRIQFPQNGEWVVRFNSTWKGYSTEFSEAEITSIITDEQGNTELPIMSYCVYVLTPSV